MQATGQTGPGQVQLPGGGTIRPVLLFRIETPPSANTSRRGGGSCAPAKEQAKEISKKHGAAARMIRKSILLGEDYRQCDAGALLRVIQV